jgi:ABC-type multidrug transport system fused ATPase/permease subunit
VVDECHIAEEGTYDELIERGGLFAELVARQRLDQES